MRARIARARAPRAPYDSVLHSYYLQLSGAGAHGECATFEVWVEAFGAELMKPHGIIDRFFAREPRQVILKRRHHTTYMVFSHFSRFRLETAE